MADIARMVQLNRALHKLFKKLQLITATLRHQLFPKTKLILRRNAFPHHSLTRETLLKASCQQINHPMTEFAEPLRIESCI